MTPNEEPLDGVEVKINPLTQGDLKQCYAMLEAFEKYVERNATYHDLWLEDDIEGTVAHIKHKAMRVAQMHRLGEEVPRDDAVDLVNYSLFLLRMVSGAN